MDLYEYVFIGLIVFGGCTIQSAVGFGAGLFAVPLMVLAGISMPRIITIISVTVFMQSIWGLWCFRADVPWRAGLPIQVLRLTTFPLGISLLAMLVDQNETKYIKLLIGLVLLVAVTVQWLGRITPRKRVHWGWTLLAGSTSGLLLGMIGIGGPSIVLWAVAHDWTTRQVRGLLWSTFVVVTAPILAVLWWRFGDLVPKGMVEGFLLTPCALVGTATGMWLGNKLSRQRMRSATFLLLILIAISTVVEAVVSS